MTPDYYAVLGVGEHATLKELKTSYRRLVKQYHPDAGFGSDEKIKIINEAYECLSDADRRRAYDAYRYSSSDSRTTSDSAAHGASAGPTDGEAAAGWSDSDEQKERAWRKRYGYEPPFIKLRRGWFTMSIGRKAMHDALNRNLGGYFSLCGLVLGLFFFVIREQRPLGFLLSGFGLFPVIVLWGLLLLVGMACGLVAGLITPASVPLRPRCDGVVVWAAFAFGPALLLSPYSGSWALRLLLYLIVSCAAGAVITYAYCRFQNRKPLSPRAQRGLYLGLVCVAVLGGTRMFLALASPPGSRDQGQSKIVAQAASEPAPPAPRLAPLNSQELGLSSQVVTVTWSAWRPDTPGLIFGSNPTPDATFSGLGSAGVYREQAGKLYLFTNQHVLGFQQIAAAREQTELAMKQFDVWVLFATGKRKPALRILHKADGPDLAALELDAADLTAGVDYVVLPPVEDRLQISPGDEVVAIGNPRGLTGTRTYGHISSIRTDQLANGEDVTLLQTDAAVNPGNSGGPLFIKADNGYLWAGINSFIVSQSGGSEGTNFAIHSKEMMGFSGEWYSADATGVSHAFLNVYKRPVGIHLKR